MSEKKVSGTALLHGDKEVPLLDTASVSPPISLTTTFRTIPPDFSLENLQNDVDFWKPKAEEHVYSRYSTSVITRVEHILSKINEGYAITYSSGLSAAYSALVLLNPKRIAITDGYHGVHMAIEVYKKSKPSVEVVDLDSDYQEGDICWLESPLNPTGESRDIKYYSDKIHRVGGLLVIDSTFGPPPLQYPFRFGADIVMHSATKYFGGHSDLLAGILVAKDQKVWNELWTNRTYVGNPMGSLEAWLLLRSLKTFHLRVPIQAENAAKLVEWLQKLASTPAGKSYDDIPGGMIQRVYHSSLQGKDARGFHPSKQMTGGYPATFAIQLSKLEYAALLPFELKVFTPATSLGGVESLVEHRLRSDASSDPKLVRLSIGVEDFSDLQADLKVGLLAVLKKVKAKL